MKKLLLFGIGSLIFLAISSFLQTPSVIDLHQLVKNKGIEVYNRELSLINEASYKGIRLSKDEGEGIAWLKGIEFSNGILEFDVRGEDVKQHSFVGIAFHGRDNNTFDAIYLRPFQFKSEDEASKKKAIQYIALPDFTWRTLREKSPGKYEGAIEPAPDPNGWVRVRIVIKDKNISTYINGSKEPNLVVEKVTNIKIGAVGFYVADTSGGDFANITITKTD
ncbi:MAG: family 16 glycoside hydrolase [Ferruginibacter sp.]